MSCDIAVVRRAARRARCAGVLTVLSLVAPAAASAQAAPDSAIHVDSLLDLPTVIRRALDVSPVMAASEGTIRTAQSEQRVATGAYVP